MRRSVVVRNDLARIAADSLWSGSVPVGAGGVGRLEVGRRAASLVVARLGVARLRGVPVDAAFSSVAAWELHEFLRLEFGTPGGIAALDYRQLAPEQTGALTALVGEGVRLTTPPSG